MEIDALQRCDMIEECYEFMLSYAAKGLPAESGEKPGMQIRECLQRAVDAMTGLVESCKLAASGRTQLDERYFGFLKILDRDAQDSLAAIELVLAQPSISSQLVDNLNASIHIRALLTDLFLVSEVVGPRRTELLEARNSGM